MAEDVFFPRTGPDEHMLSRPDVVICSHSEAGHRASAIALFSRLLRGERRSGWRLYFARQPVLFLMIEDNFAEFVLVALVRAALGWRTVGLLFRPKPALEGATLRHRTKRKTLELLRRVQECRVLTIIPFPLDRRMSTIADGWIFDFQLWDLTEEERAAATAGGPNMPSSAVAQAVGRRTVCALGSQDRAKGFDAFLRAYCDSAKIRERYLFAFGGRASSGFAEDLAAFDAVGGYSLDRRVTDSELMSFYGISDLVWTYYAADYDQASGIFGRAVQLGIPPIVRQGSLLHSFCNEENIAHVAFDGTDVDRIADADLPKDAPQGKARAEKFAAYSVASLRGALGLVGQAGSTT